MTGCLPKNGNKKNFFTENLRQENLESRRMEDSSREKKKVLFVCTHNSARSQMAEGLLRAMGGPGFEVQSAGTTATEVRPEAIAVMREEGIDLSGHFSKTLDGFLDVLFDYVVTVCDHANTACPVFPHAANRLHWPVEDPAGVQGDEAIRLAAFRKARDELRERIQEAIL
jgi:arsenate reductase